jgi:hypothetical protein
VGSNDILECNFLSENAHRTSATITDIKQSVVIFAATHNVLASRINTVPSLSKTTTLAVERSAVFGGTATVSAATLPSVLWNWGYENYERCHSPSGIAINRTHD